jgi:Fe-S cluster assembly protein SufD
MKGLTDFAGIADTRNLFGQDLPWLKSLRLKAVTEFNHNGLPEKKQEDWKYTSLWDLSQHEFTHQPSKLGLSKIDCEQYALLNDSYRFVIVDGVFSAELSQLDDLPEGVLIEPLSQSVNAAQPHLNQQIDITKPGFNALNTFLMSEGATITLQGGIKLEKTIEILIVNTGDIADLASHLRHVIVLDEDSQATVVEHYVSVNETRSFTNVVSEVFLSKNATLNHYKLQQESKQAYHIATLAAKQSTLSQWNTNSISLGAKLARNDIHSQLLGQHSHVTMDGLYIVDGEQHVDHHTRIDHAVPNTTSEELFKGVLNERSHAVFNGKVMVHKDAQKTDANQQNHNLLLSRGCEIDTKPEMEIYADDVKAAHGSTVGQLNEDNLFFLRARGLDEVSARSLLTYAFAVDVLERIPCAVLRQAFSTIVERHLPQGGTAE